MCMEVTTNIKALAVMETRQISREFKIEKLDIELLIFKFENYL